MKINLFLMLACFFPFFISAQDCDQARYHRLLKQGDSLYNKAEYLEAVRTYNSASAAAVCPAGYQEIQEKIVRVFEQIDRIKEKAVANGKKAKTLYLSLMARTVAEKDPTRALRIIEAAYAMDSSNIPASAYEAIAIIKPYSFYSKKIQHQAVVYEAVFSPDRQRMLTCSGDNTARLWDLQGNELAICKGHEDLVKAAVFSPAGDCVLTASWDKTARLWDLQGKELAICKGHEDAVCSAVFSPSGDRVLTASDDHTARLWLMPQGLMNWLKTAPVYQLSEEEKREYGLID